MCVFFLKKKNEKRIDLSFCTNIHKYYTPAHQEHGSQAYFSWVAFCCCHLCHRPRFQTRNWEIRDNSISRFGFFKNA